MGGAGHSSVDESGDLVVTASGVTQGAAGGMSSARLQKASPAGGAGNGSLAQRNRVIGEPSQRTSESPVRVRGGG